MAGSVTDAKNDPKVLIGMVTLNSRDTLPRSLESIAGLDYDLSRVTLVLEDAGSTDGSTQLIEEFAEKYRSRFRKVVIVRDPPGTGIAAGRNRILDHLTDEEYVFFVDSDVVLPRDALKRLLRLMAPSVGIAFLFYSYHSYERPPPGVVSVKAFGMGCTLIRREVIEACGRFDERLRCQEDADFCLRASKLGYRLVLDSSSHAEHLKRFSGSRIRRILSSSIKHRRDHAILTLKHRTWALRTVIGFVLLVTTLSSLITRNLLLLAPLVAYFLLQLARRKDLEVAFAITLNSLILPLAVTLGMLEQALGLPKELTYRRHGSS